MPENSRKPLTALPNGIPDPWRDFVRCRRDSVDLEPGELDWLPNMTSLTLNFEEGVGGSTTLRLSGLGGILDIEIAISVVDGRLVADTSDIPVAGNSADDWIDNFNADLQANGMQLSNVSLRSGRLRLSKAKIATDTDSSPTSTSAAHQPPMTPAPPPAHITNPIPEPLVHQPSPAPPPTHVTDPIPEPVTVETTDDGEPEESIPHADQAALQAPYSQGARPSVARRWSKWSGRGAATAGAFVLSVAAFFIFVDGREESPSTTSPAGQNTESSTNGPADSTTATDVESPSTSSEPTQEEPLSIGMDSTGDQEDGNTSQMILPGQEIPGGDITQVSHRIEPDTSHTIVVNLAGDGMQFTEPGNAWYDVIVSVEDQTGGVWRANGAWFSGQYTDRGIRLGPAEPGQVAIPDGVVSITFLGPDSFEMNIDGGDEPLNLSTFTATVGVSVDDQTLWDSAIGTAGSL